MHQPPGGILRISIEGDDRRIFLGLKFSIPGIFWVGKFGKYLFGGLVLSRNFWGIQINLEIRGIRCPRILAALSFCVMLLLKQEMFLGVSSVVRMTTRRGKDYFRWHDEQTNTNIQFLMFLFFYVISFNAF